MKRLFNNSTKTRICGIVVGMKKCCRDYSLCYVIFTSARSLFGQTQMVGSGPGNRRLTFGGAPDHRLDTGTVSGFDCICVMLLCMACTSTHRHSNYDVIASLASQACSCVLWQAKLIYIHNDATATASSCSSNIHNGSPFWLTQVVLNTRLLNRCSCSSSSTSNCYKLYAVSWCMCDWLDLDCIMQCHQGTSVAAVHHKISNYLKMAPYRQGGAGKGASLESDVASPGDNRDTDVEADDDDDC